MIRRIGLVAIVLLAVSGCAMGDAFLGAPPSGYVQDVGERVAAVDWSAARTIEVALDEYDFSPEALVFEQGVPYRLRLENTGGRTHTFVAREFFQAIAAYRLTSAAGEVTEPYIERIEVRPGAQKELMFVPVKAGAYPLECTVFLHDVLGMTGLITVE
ncbi:MAG: hypothetical protein ACE5LL_05335 [Alphaproteobacteria bacterium]